MAGETARDWRCGRPVVFRVKESHFSPEGAFRTQDTDRGTGARKEGGELLGGKRNSQYINRRPMVTTFSGPSPKTNALAAPASEFRSAAARLPNADITYVPVPRAGIGYRTRPRPPARRWATCSYRALTLLLRCFAEHLRLQKKIAGLPFTGRTSGPTEEIVWSCSQCGHVLHSDTCCDACGAHITQENGGVQQP